MKAIRFLGTLLAGVLLFGAVGCFNPTASGDESEKDEPIVEQESILEQELHFEKGYLPLVVQDQSNGRTTEGFGAQSDTHIFKEVNGNRYTQKDWDEWLHRIDEMNLQCIRTQVFPEWFERGNDNNDPNVFDKNSKNVDFNSIEMQQLYRLLDICEERNISVDLSFYGCNVIYQSQDGKIKGSWLGYDFSGNWVTAPRTKNKDGSAFPGYEEYAESVYVLLDYLLNVKKYTCLYEFSIYPEPNGSFLNENLQFVDDEFIRFYKVVDDRLKKEGIKSKILCSGPGDCNNNPEFYEKYTKVLGDCFNKNTSSVYVFNETATNQQMYDYASTSVKICDKNGMTWGVCETGSNRFIDPANQEDIDTYERGLFLARQMINFMNAGCTNIKYWVLNDVWYDGYVMRLGLWKLADERFHAEARPQFYFWSLITRYTEKGSQIYPIASADPDVCMTAFKLPNGKWSYMVANSSKFTKDITIANRHSTAQKTMNIYEVAQSTLPTDNRVVASKGTVEMKNCTFNYKMRPNSFVVFSNK